MPAKLVLNVYAVYGWCGMRIGTVTEYSERAALREAQVLYPGAVGVEHLHEALDTENED